MVTAKGQESDRVAGPGAGRGRLRGEALLRARAAASREGGAAPHGAGLRGRRAILSAGDIQLDPARHEVMVKRHEVVLTALEFRLLQDAARAPRPGADPRGAALATSGASRRTSPPAPSTRTSSGCARSSAPRATSSRRSAASATSWRAPTRTRERVAPAPPHRFLLPRHPAPRPRRGHRGGRARGRADGAPRRWRSRRWWRFVVALASASEAAHSLVQAADVADSKPARDESRSVTAQYWRCRRSPRPSRRDGRGHVDHRRQRGGAPPQRGAQGDALHRARSWSASGRCSSCARTELHDAVIRACREGSDLEGRGVDGRAPAQALEVHVAPLGGALPGSAAVFHDVTELQRLERVRQDFVANVSHELRTPITAIRGYAETLAPGALPTRSTPPRWWRSSTGSPSGSASWSRTCSSCRRLDAGERPLLVAPRVARRGRPGRRARRWSPGPPASACRFELRIPAGPRRLGPTPKALEQVLLNLLDNAIKYTPEGGTVELTRRAAWATGRELSVKDTGLGIEARHLPRLFERFYRVDRGRSRDMGGTGLGLSIVKHLVHGDGGRGAGGEPARGWAAPSPWCSRPASGHGGRHPPMPRDAS